MTSKAELDDVIAKGLVENEDSSIRIDDSDAEEEELEEEHQEQAVAPHDEETINRLKSEIDSLKEEVKNARCEAQSARNALRERTEFVPQERAMSIKVTEEEPRKKKNLTQKLTDNKSVIIIILVLIVVSILFTVVFRAMRAKKSCEEVEEMEGESVLVSKEPEVKENN